MKLVNIVCGWLVCVVMIGLVAGLYGFGAALLTFVGEIGMLMFLVGLEQ